MKITPIPAPNILDDPPQKPTTIKEIANAVDTLPTLLQSIFDIMIEMEGKDNDSPTESPATNQSLARPQSTADTN